MVGWLVNLVKWAKIVISEPIWLKFGMNAPNVYKNDGLRLFRLQEVVGWLVGWLVNLANWAKIVLSEWI